MDNNLFIIFTGIFLQVWISQQRKPCRPWQPAANPPVTLTRREHVCFLHQTILPASAQDVYYRDEIGNISTSHLQVLDDSVEVEIRPRFPLFGGWKTHYLIGYNLPSYEYLYTLGELISMFYEKHQKNEDE